MELSGYTYKGCILIFLMIREVLMKKTVVCVAIAVLLGYQFVLSQSFTVKAQYGDVQVFQGAAGKRVAVTGDTKLAMGDSLILGPGSQGVVALEPNTRLNFRGPGALTITGDSSTAYLSFDNGMLFLDRVEPTTFSVLTFWIRNYMFVPAGTAAAFRVMQDGKPVAAVLEGKVLMQSPTGESAEVLSGQFGYVDASGRIGNGTLGKKMVEALEKWSNVKMGGMPAKSGASSPDLMDKEFITALESAPSTKPANTMATKTATAAKPAPGAASPQAQKNVAMTPASSKPQAVLAASPAPKPAAQQANEDQGKKDEATGDRAAAEQKSAAPEKPTWEITAGSVTVEDEQWTRLGVGVDVPIWKFGIFFDLEAFIDPAGKFSDKGWRFADDQDYLEAITRKIRYVRFGHEQDPVFVKIGGISNVSLGYGFIVDRFTNMLHYPDQKLLGGQLYLNNITPIGLTVQAFGADAQEARIRDNGGLGAARLAVCPLKMQGIPIVSSIAIGGTFAYDRNTYAPARHWKNTREQKIALILDDGTLSDDKKQQLLDSAGIDIDGANRQLAAENAAREKIEPFGIYGGDISVPIITTPLLSLDIYAQAAARSDTVHGWGVGAPGVALKVWRLSANLEYRHINGRFMPGFFGTYYLDERLQREPSIGTKVDALPDDTLNGAFGRLEFDLYNVLTVNGGYQYMIGSGDKSSKDQRFEVAGSLGSMITERIPKVKSAEAYLYKTRINADIAKYDSTGAPVMVDGEPVYDEFFEKTPFMYYGYRVGIAISEGATLVWDSRFGWLRDSRGRLTANNNISVQTVISF
jgi:hypothetical protein